MSLAAASRRDVTEGATSSFKSITWNKLCYLLINYKLIWDSRSVENVSTNVYAKFCCALLRIKKALGIFRELIPIRRTITTRVAFRDPLSGSNNVNTVRDSVHTYVKTPFSRTFQDLQRPNSRVFQYTKNAFSMTFKDTVKNGETCFATELKNFNLAQRRASLMQLFRTTS